MMKNKLIFGLLFALCSSASLQAQASLPAGTPADWVRRAADSEARANEAQSDFFAYTLEKHSKSGKALREVVELKEGILARTVRWNDRALTPEETAKEDARLTKLLSDTEERRKKFREQGEEMRRVLRLVKALPDALLWEYESTEELQGRPTLRLRFVPNRKYQSSNRETMAFRATKGKAWIDLADMRIVKLDAALTDDVTIGWGLLGRINRGGKLLLEQTLVGENKWRISTLIIDASGKALIFKSIQLKQRQFGTNYRAVSKLTLEQAIEMLRHSAVARR